MSQTRADFAVRFEHLNFGHSDLFRVSDFEFRVFF